MIIIFCLEISLRTIRDNPHKYLVLANKLENSSEDDPHRHLHIIYLYSFVNNSAVSEEKRKKSDEQK